MSSILNSFEIQSIAEKYRKSLEKDIQEVSDVIVERAKKLFEEELPIISYDPHNKWLYYEITLPIVRVQSDLGSHENKFYFIETLEKILESRCDFFTRLCPFNKDSLNVSLTEHLIIFSFVVQGQDYKSLHLVTLPDKLYNAILDLEVYQNELINSYSHDETLWQADVDYLVSETLKGFDDILTWNVKVLNCVPGYESVVLEKAFNIDPQFNMRTFSYGDVLYSSRPVPPFTNRSSDLKDDLESIIENYDPKSLYTTDFINEYLNFRWLFQKQYKDSLHKKIIELGYGNLAYQVEFGMDKILLKIKESV